MTINPPVAVVADTEAAISRFAQSIERMTRKRKLDPQVAKDVIALFVRYNEDLGEIAERRAAELAAPAPRE